MHVSGTVARHRYGTPDPEADHEPYQEGQTAVAIPQHVQLKKACQRMKRKKKV